MSDRHDFDIDAFLSRPLVARLATNGPTVRPIWFLWEDGAFWWLTGPWSQLEALLDDPRVALVVDTCDLATGRVRQVIAKGRIEVHPYDRERAIRKLRRYLGPDVSAWDERFDPDSMPEAKFLRLAPTSLNARDLSFQPRSERPSP
ncbi:MAG: pyridoxamine 5'-phosphate oxidase family protein [Actinomycetota bacterium]|nr:pyridoxamine 5'-phosphate oxidase family protein [Actinomycetota bacterium]